MRVLVYGAGYVGLATAVILARTYQVTLTDVDEKRLTQIDAGIGPIVEDGLDAALRAALSSGNLRVAVLGKELGAVDVVLVCVGTPPTEHGLVDLSAIQSVTDRIEKHIETIRDSYLLLAVRSTILPGMTREIVLSKMGKHVKEGRVGVVFQPEFLRQGMALRDISEPDRVIVGASDETSLQKYIEFIKPTIRNDCPIFTMSIESAELCKYASNAFLATKISFSSELSSLAERLELVEIDDVIKGMTADHRICPSHLKPDLGFGGSCFPKDVSGLQRFAETLGVPMDLLSSVQTVNRRTITRLMNLTRGLIDIFTGRKVAVLGLTFKAGTDDTRGSQSLDLIQELLGQQFLVYVHDPVVSRSKVEILFGNRVVFCDGVADCLAGADLAFLMTDWDEYSELGIARLTSEMRTKAFVDGRRVFVNESIPQNIAYRALGRLWETG